ncbi:unnamed protein product [Linum trigynum]|uniref:Uncharacterized protein n=1 Tax=Linum trigynum TaxID=586398 RepID=A0AAV2G2M7_9ROSI
MTSSEAGFVLDSNNLWVVGSYDGTIAVLGGPDVAYPNTRDVTGDVRKWAETARIGTIPPSTHRSLELFGVVFSGQKLEELRKNLYDHQVAVNREGFTVQWLNLGGDSKEPNEGSLYRRLNDLFDWSSHGVKVPAPVQTEWDRYQLGSGELMAELSGLAQLPVVVAELEEENQTLRDEKDVEIRELKKGGGGGQEQSAAKDKMIAALRDALKLFL